MKFFIKDFHYLHFFAALSSARGVSKVCDVKDPGNNPAGKYMFKFNSRTTRTRYEICSKLTIKILERCQWRRSGVFVVNFEHISNIVLVFLSLTLNI